MKIVLLLLVLFVLLLGCALGVMWVPLPRPFPPAGSSERILIAAVTTGLLGVVYLIALVVYLISSLSNTSRSLDPLFTSLGLASQGYMASGRQYHGALEGRPVDLYWTPAHSLRHALLDAYVDADLDVRVAVAAKRPLLDCADCPAVDVTAPGLGHLRVYTRDEAWARRLYADPASVALLGRLVGEAGARELYLQPGRVWLRLRPQRVTEAQLRQRLDDLLAFAEAVEQVDVP